MSQLNESLILCAYGQVDLITRFAAFKIATKKERNPWACLENFYSCAPWRWGLCFCCCCCLMPEVAVLPDYDFCHTFRVSGRRHKFFYNGKTWICKKCHLETYLKTFGNCYGIFPPGKVLTMEWEEISCQI